jgi:hypothetical protein
MGTRLARHLTFANVMAAAAVFVVLGGTSYAAAGKLGKHSVKGRNIAKNAITSPKVKDGSLLVKDFKAGQLPAGAKGDAGPAGPTGPKGETGAMGPANPASGGAGGDLTGVYPNPTLRVPLTLADTLTAPFLAITGDNNNSLQANPQDAMLAVNQTNANGTGPSIYGETNSKFSNFGTAGLMGVSSGTGGTGLLARATNVNGNGAAAMAISEGNGNGLVANSAKGNGIEATSDVGTTSTAGVYGWSPNFVTAGTGVRATAFGPNGVGLRAKATGAGGKAAIFEGNVDVVGTLSKSGGSFKIDHPTDPANKYLSHSFVESPDMKNIYDGIVTTDGKGFATVTMPDWFDALNGHFRYQLTVLGRSFARAIVWEEMTGDRFTIRTDEPRVKVSWQVTGTREDAFAKAHRIPVEEEKTGAERGRYLMPELFGQPASKAIGAGG